MVIYFRRRIALGWAAFGKVDNIVRSRKASMKIKRKIHNDYILPVMTYGCETWTLNNFMTEKLADAQRKIERITLGITLRDRKQNPWIRHETGVSDIVNAVRMAKHWWAGLIARLPGNRWTIRATERTPRYCTRKQGSPRTPRRDDLTKQLPFVILLHSVFLMLDIGKTFWEG